MLHAVSLETIPRPRPFRSERELQDHFGRLHSLKDQNFPISYMRREVPLGRCIPDFIFVRFRGELDRQLWPRQFASRHSHLIWLLRNKGPLLSKEAASLSFMLHGGQFLRTVSELMDSGAVIRLKSGELTLSQKLTELEFEVIAIEAKLRRWRDALKQAENYLGFADKAIVVMDAYYSPSKPNVIDEFQQKGIGLCAVGPDETNIYWTLAPRKVSSPKNPYHEYLMASAIAKSGWEAKYLKYASC